MTTEDIQQSIDAFDLTKPDQDLADAWVLATSYQKRFKPISDEYKLLTKFMHTLDSKRKLLAKTQLIDEPKDTDDTVS